MKPSGRGGAGFLRRAIQLALDNVALARGGPFGAVIVRGGAVIAEGTNLVTSTNDPSAHAEIVAIRGACTLLGTYDLSGCEIYASCEPCPMCLGAIYWAHLSTLTFSASHDDAAGAGFDDSHIYGEMHLSIERRAIPTKRMLVREGRAPFRAWRGSASKIPY